MEADEVQGWRRLRRGGLTGAEREVEGILVRERKIDRKKKCNRDGRKGEGKSTTMVHRDVKDK